MSEKLYPCRNCFTYLDVCNKWVATRAEHMKDVIEEANEIYLRGCACCPECDHLPKVGGGKTE